MTFDPTKPVRTPLEALKAANAAAEEDALGREWDDIQADWEAVALAKLRELGWVIVPATPPESIFPAVYTALSAMGCDSSDEGDVWELYRAMIEESQK